jgi:Protein of unknown function (DUF4232)
MSAQAPVLPFEVDPLIAEAKRRARRRRLVAVIALLALGGAAALGVRAFGGGVSPGAVPWLPTRPQLGPANPPLAPACTASQLRASLFVQGAAGNLAGGIRIANRSSQACALVGRPKLSFGAWRVTRGRQGGAANPFDPLAPPLGSLRALAPGRHASVSLWWPGICAGASHSDNAPRGVVLTAPGGGRIELRGAGFPYCNVPSASAVQVTRYAPFVPQDPPSSALPLKARIVSGPPLVIGSKHISQSSLAAHPGSWLSYTVVLTNRSRRSFRFGRSCPAYTEGVGTQNQAYILNCHAIGSIGPGRSVRFAMRVHVPRRLADPFPPLGWTLAPHSWNAPGAFAVVDVR